MQQRLAEKFREEPYAKLFGIDLVELGYGRALVKMEVKEEMMNLFGMAHGGAVFSLMDAAFELAANSYGTVAVALAMSVNYINPALAGRTLYAEAREVSRSSRISTYDLDVKGSEGELIASCQAMAYRKKDKLPFL
ncbi:MAG: hotdog fold thioesterase [Methanotrichaceae archaeon]|nr:hotdog fold thioesterase [Methanotrichaceae archaeon]